MRYRNCLTCSKYIGWFGLAGNFALFLMNLLVGLVAGSQALVVGAMYALKDMATSVFVVVGVTLGRKPLDREHPYGHGKIEFIMSLVFGLVLLFLAVYLLYHAVNTLLVVEHHVAPRLIAVWAAFVSVLAYVYGFYYASCVAIESNSPVVRIMARHHHSDAITAGVAGLGIVAAHLFGLPWIDTVVAFFEALDLSLLGFKVFWDSSKGLLDRGLDPGMRAVIHGVVGATEGVREVKSLRTRLVGHQIWSEIVIGVDADMTVEQAHGICEQVKRRVAERVRHIGSLTVDAEICEAEIGKNRELHSQWRSGLARLPSVAGEG
ncbi:Magnetosome protein MamM [Rhodovastum atsumiense]|uniref:Magnetosome biogenesis CDF transporter MamM n=1 Tax=Rhodovastum atsumiense TaxID=504468 RepID=A0A5M6IP15_9PROT|nr:magnetosome biogenesis CDF transporter MamM [Rhodovastum atsumiense]KAA5610000.1 magnetosome biogenesis CDF transporter MamM [Rhodovastum atsumiense]CAH2598643.1 Magnetosome protein MamM [Rhodovastum atsumiense]